MYVQNYVVAGVQNSNPGSLSMCMVPVKHFDRMGIAIKSTAYSEVYDVSG